MSFAGALPLPRRGQVLVYCAASLLVPFSVLLTLSCADRVRAPTSEQLAAFMEAGAAQPAVDLDYLRRARLHTGPYRVVPDDVLEFTMPSLLQSVMAAELHGAKEQIGETQPYICRISTRGTITLPAAEEITVSGASLAEIEEKVIEAYRHHVVLRPSVFVRVLEYKTCPVAVMGAVTKPGIYALRGDQMSLVALLMEAGGIIKDGAATVRIARLDSVQGSPVGEDAVLPPPAAEGPGPQQSVRTTAAIEERVATRAQHPPAGKDRSEGGIPEEMAETQALVLPVRGWNIPFRDVVLKEGDTVVVEQLQVPLFSVLGLVNRPGNFPYPPTAQYTLAQAIGFAEGLDPVADPRYATIYRLTKDGTTTRVAFKLIEEGEFTEALATPVKPGDVVAVEHTARTRANTTINHLLRINTGLYLTGHDLWGND